ncbi:hypothetical protein [Saccharothrix lopnurensis]|uniref:Uncharacterized protein n=1 Tax=Saccharothrix lopnurensis TaxID=1670621 RepID=A0ABW1P3S9_9PSEU
MTVPDPLPDLRHPGTALAKTAETLRHVEVERARGKVVLVVPN